MNEHRTIEAVADPFFVCRVCGVKVDLHPADGPGVCELHCEDHDFKRSADLPWPACMECGKWAPHDWYDGYYDD